MTRPVARNEIFLPRCALACCLSLLGERQLLSLEEQVPRHFPECGEPSNLPLPTPADPISHLLHDSGLAMRPLRSRALGVAPEQVHEPGQVLGSRPRPVTLTRTHPCTCLRSHTISPPHAYHLHPQNSPQRAARAAAACHTWWAAVAAIWQAQARCRAPKALQRHLCSFVVFCLLLHRSTWSLV